MISEQSKGIDFLFTPLLKNNKILYIHIFMDRIKHPDRDYLIWLKGNLLLYGNFDIANYGYYMQEEYIKDNIKYKE